MNAFFFGTSDHPLFGAYDPPPGGGRRGVVLCHPWGREYLLAYPSLRHLARVLSARGWHVLRFDYFGTGDSAGDESALGVGQWLADVDMAVTELRDISHASRVALAGLRLGAALAAQAAARRPDIDRVVLWDPVFDGRAYLAQLGATRQSAPTESVDVLGAVLTAELRSDMLAVTPESFGSLPQTLIVNTLPASGAYAPLAARLTVTGVTYSVSHVPDVSVWQEEWGSGGVGMAVAAVNAIADWMS